LDEKLKRSVEGHLEKDEIKDALKLLKGYDDDLAKPLFGQYNSIKKRWSEGTISASDYTLETNRLRSRIFNVVKEAYEDNQDSNLSKKQLTKQDVLSKKTLKGESHPIDFKDLFLNQLETLLRKYPELMPKRGKVNVWSAIYLDEQIKRLKQLRDGLDPHNFYKLMDTLDELDQICKKLTQVVSDSGNTGSKAYETLEYVNSSKNSLRASLQELDDNQWKLKVGTAKLKSDLLQLIRELESKRTLAFRFSEN